MDAKIKCLSDDDKGFTKGELYPVLTFGESVALLRNDTGSVVGVTYAQINGELWELQPLDDDKAADKPKPDMVQHEPFTQIPAATTLVSDYSQSANNTDVTE
jgi:hypothetical protein